MGLHSVLVGFADPVIVELEKQLRRAQLDAAERWKVAHFRPAFASYVSLGGSEITFTPADRATSIAVRTA